MWNTIATQLGELTLLSVFVRLLLSAIFGGIIGIDGGRKRRAAGLRTHMLVCLGSTLVMITNQYITLIYQTSDPARLGAQVISGIGFLGAGTIIVTRHQQVKGLTTAAGLWASACMGLAIGVGFYEAAIMGCLFIICIIVFLNRLDTRVMSRSRVMEVYVEMKQDSTLSSFLGYVTNHGIHINHIEIIQPVEAARTGTTALLTLRLPKKFDHDEVLIGLRRVEGLGFIDEV